MSLVICGSTISSLLILITEVQLKLKQLKNMLIELKKNSVCVTKLNNFEAATLLIFPFQYTSSLYMTFSLYDCKVACISIVSMAVLKDLPRFHWQY